MKKLKKQTTTKILPEKKDTSPRVHQREKIDYTLNLRGLDWTEKQKAFIDLATHKDTKIIFLSGPAGTSKAQPNDAQILTPEGWELMENIKEGDYVYAINGKPTRVLSVHPQGIKDIYKISFSDGTSTECTKDHLWLTKTYNERTYLKNFENRNKRRKAKNRPEYEHKDSKYINTCINGSVKTLEEIMNSIDVGTGKKPHKNHTIPLISQPLEFEKKEHIISPYIMGILLGDGCLRTQVMFTTADEEILEKIKKEIPESMEVVNAYNIDYRLVSKNRDKKNLFLNEIRRMNLAGTYSDTKFIPHEYLFDSAENRLELLKGLMDSDGFVAVRARSSKTNLIGFGTASKQLAEGVRFLVESLGGVATCTRQKTFFTYKGRNKQGKSSYQLFLNIPINPFYIARKSLMFKERVKYFPSRYISSVEYVGQKPAQCLLVEDPNHLYLTNNCIVTHNTILAVYSALLLLNQKRASDLIYVRTIVESAAHSMGTLPGDMSDKLHYFVSVLNDKLEELLPAGDIKRLHNDDRVKGMPVNYLRGASYNAKVVIVDEAQNANFSELLTSLTRIGKFTKYYILGDPMQTDLKHKEQSGFKAMYDLFNDEESRQQGIHCVEFTKDDIMRSEILKFIIDKVEQYNLSKK